MIMMFQINAQLFLTKIRMHNKNYLDLITLCDELLIHQWIRFLILSFIVCIEHCFFLNIITIIS